ncbi:MAG: hypothetical protein OSJ70_00730 [Bacilli bacterium]|nr:hypothetical protein [Bacilli bacterium]
MKTLKDYFDNSLFNKAISCPLDYDGLLDKECATKGIDTYSTDGTSQVSKEEGDITLIKGEKSQYWLGRNTRIDENLKDIYNYEVKLTQYDDSISLEVESDVERFVGSNYWDTINLPTYQIATIPNENGRYHISFEEYYSLRDGVLVHETTLSDKVEVFLVPDEFTLGDSFADFEKFVLPCMNMQEEIKKIKELKNDKE